MTYKTKMIVAALTGALLTATIAQAQDATPQADDMQVSKDHSMEDGMAGMHGKKGMMPMMKMMAQMGPMMEACTEMMQNMNDHMDQAGPEAQKG